MMARSRDPRFIGGLVLLGVALLIAILSLVDWAAHGAALHLGVAGMFLVAGAMLLSSSRRASTIGKD